MKESRCCFVIAILIFCSCSAVRNTPKYQFSKGRYTSRVLDLPSKKVHVDMAGDMIRVYPLKKVSGRFTIDTLDHKALIFTNDSFDNVAEKTAFWQASFDIDFLTIPFKYRFPLSDFPRQFNTHLNGAVYLGYRSDVYVLQYQKDLLEQLSMRTLHFGFSFGSFSGLGGTPMNPWVTNNQIAIEYDGVVWSKGVVGIIGFNAFTAGLALGWDHLLDKNKKHWIYQSKPWVGLAFGLNLN